MSKYVVYQEISDELVKDTAAWEAFEPMLKQQMIRYVRDKGLTIVSDMDFQLHEMMPRTVDPYEFMTRFEKILVFIRLKKCPESYIVSNWAMRGIVEVKESNEN